MSKPIRRLFRSSTDDNGITRVKAATGNELRSKDIDAGPWLTNHYDRNPVIIWNHDYTIPSIGRGLDVVAEGADLDASIEWDMDDPLGALVGGKYARGMLSAVSVGFMPGRVRARAALEKTDTHYGPRGRVQYDNELWEISGVNIPDDRDALAPRSVGDESDPAVIDLLQDWTRNGLKGEVRTALLDLFRADPEVRGVLEAMMLTFKVESSAEELAAWWG